ncbi:hypothetical protein GCM10011321_28870 [Youhaiella tibetensis]|uniref:Antitoxin n=1 Tax=Paradevosia tibetensis TaxID=1447062 RepID=A0A5B9DJ54_9HYPH|nr:type II toxin-antitoxin system Phd/YefM family antitoxin [Youhaiella tibetensis]QEE19123.1 type II toxin-antitoxin system Phd/YefM family antitoxin [Youhaiella tibetensis]GGF36065.1 hypothetical protein GCM10011321_28870 [Youhaiella tibetensis]
MPTITATAARNKFGQLLNEAQQEPVHIQRHGRDVAVVVSVAEYERLRQLIDRPNVSRRVEELLKGTVAKRGAVYRALAR